MTHHVHIAARAFNTPLLIEPRKALAFVRGLGPRLLGEQVDVQTVIASADDEALAVRRPFASLLGDELADDLNAGRLAPYTVRHGVAIVPVSGVLVHRGAWIGRSSGQTSYEGLRAQIDRAAVDPEVKAIALEVDSCGGEVAGCFDLADRIRAVRAIKPVRAFVAESAFSAAYALAAQADAIVVARTGGVGSIGVMCMHVDMSGALAEAGLAVTLIHAGRHKVDGNQYAPLPDPVRADVQTEMESLRRIFARTVHLGRGERLTARAAMATEARCLRAREAVAAGLADAVGDPREAFDAFLSEVSPSATAPKQGGPSMGQSLAARAANDDEDIDELDEETAMDDEDEAATPDEEDEAVDEPVEPDEEDGDDEPVAARTRARVRAILSAPSAKGRGALARYLALDTSLSVKKAIGALKAAPTASADRGDLGARMAGRAPAIVSAPAGAPPAVSPAAQMRARFGKS